MAAKMSQKEYLKKYLSGGKSSDVKKKKKKRAKGTGLQIIDDDIDVSRLQPLDSAEIDILLDGNEDAPQIAGIVDDRPEEVRKMEQFRMNSKWRVLTEDDGFNSKVKIEEVKGKRMKAEGQTDSDSSPSRNTYKNTDVNTGTINKQKQREIRHGSGESHPRKGKYSEIDKSSKYRRNSANSNDATPPRKKSEKSHHKPSQKSDSDVSPPRKSRPEKSNSDVSPPRKTKHKSMKSDSDESPPRKSRPKSRKSDLDVSPPRKSTHHQQKSDSDVSPPRKSRHKSDSDISPPRKSRHKVQKSDSDVSPPRKSRNKVQKSDSDVSPPRKSRHKVQKSDSDVSPPRKSRHKVQKSDSDVSPPRKSRQKADSDQSPVKKRRLGNESDRDVSPPRKSIKRPERKSRWGYFEDPDKRKSDNTTINSDDRRRRDCSPDASPPIRKKNYYSPDRNTQKSRKRPESEDPSRPRKRNGDSTERYGDLERNRRDDRRDRENPQSNSSKQERTLEGKKAGFRDAKQFLQDEAEFKKKEHEMFQKMDDDVSGRNAQTVSRKTGRKRQPSVDKEQQERDSAKQREREEKYSRWGRGLKQTEEREGRVEDYLHESNKPLARYRDDEDLEVMLKRQEREGDPMANYMRDKHGETGTVLEAKPIYKGSYPPNRFQIRPGYRWDGVDRSSGYEKKFFETKNSRIAMEKDAYKWSTEDM